MSGLEVLQAQLARELPRPPIHYLTGLSVSSASDREVMFAADGLTTLARGRVLHAGRRIAVANAEIIGADGRPVAVATGSARLLPGRPASLLAAES